MRMSISTIKERKMGGNIVAGGVLLDVYDLQVTGDESPKAGDATDVTVSFKFTEPFYTVFFRPQAWPFTVKVYAEGLGGDAPWPPEPGPVERRWQQGGSCTQGNPDYQVKVPVTLNREGVYKLSAIVELDNNAGFVMGFSEKEAQVTAWTAV
jgi:hypothetical protein